MATYSAISDPDKKYIQGLLGRYIECAEYLIEKCRSLQHIKGAQKLERKCLAELKFLKSLSRRQSEFDESHLRSSNLSHYLGVIHAAENLPDVSQILQAFRCPGRTESLHVDVVAGQGHLWIKVIARKGQALHLIWAGQGQYGERDILLQATDYVTCTTVHPVNFVNPTMVFAFYNGVTSPMADALRRQTITVIGEIVGVSDDVENKLAYLAVDDELSVDGNSHDDSDDGSNDDHVETETNLSEVNFENPNDVFHTHKVPMEIVDRFSPHGKCKVHVVDESEQVQITPKHYKRDALTSTESDLKVSDIQKIQDGDNNVCVQQACVDLVTTNTDEQQQPQVQGSYCHGTAGGIVNETFKENNESTQQVPDNQIISFANGKYDGKSIYPSSSNNTDRIACCIDSDIINDSRHSNITKLMNTNTGDCVKNNMSKGLHCPQSQFHHGIGFANVFDDNLHCEFDDQKWTAMSLDEFIVSELVTSNTVDYSQLDGILTENNIHSIASIGKVNLDVTSLITLVSSVAHGRCYYKFKEPILCEQAAEERVDPVMPKLQKFITGKKLYACQTAVKSFQTILDTLGGDSECTRAKDLMERVTIVPDNPSFRTESLPNTGKIKDRSKIIFGTGDSLQAVTLTANSGFVRAAQHQGVLFAVHIHASRALTEQKEKSAEIIDS